MPPAKASLFERGTAPATAPVAGLTPLAAHVHATDPAVSGALADWLADVYALEGQPSASFRQGLRPGMLLVNRAGHQFTRHTVSFHAPDAVDAGLLARQAEIEVLEDRAAGPEQARRSAAGPAEGRRARRDRWRRRGAPSRANHAHGARHDAQIEELKLTQSEERYRERRAKSAIDPEAEKARDSRHRQLAIARSE
jgi:chromosome segregation protein